MRKSFAWLVAGVLGSGLAAAVCSAESAVLYGAHGVSPQAVLQGTLGSCYFHASIAALAKAAPEKLRAAISENPGGGYRVRFVDGPDEIVLPEDVAFARDHVYDRSEGTWVAVLMRGYAQRQLRQSLVRAINKSDLFPSFVKTIALTGLDQSDQILIGYDRAVRSVVQQDGVIDKAALKTKLAAQLTALGVPDTAIQMLGGFMEDRGFFDTIARTVEENGEVFGAYKSLGQGGVPVRVFEAFQGKGFSGLVADKKLTMEQLRRLGAGHIAMVAGSWGTPTGEGYSSATWWVAGHCYTVLNFDEEAQTITLRNPWGAKPDPDGVFTIPLATFFDAFEFYTYSQPQGF
ncbi:MAG: hypothetical protein WAN35_21710 [Terracidiphilus sp.]